MKMEEETEDPSETEKCLARVQNFDSESLIRRDDLGKYAFDDAVYPAKRVISLFNTLPLSHLSYFPQQQLEQIKNSTNSFYSLLSSSENSMLRRLSQMSPTRKMIS